MPAPTPRLAGLEPADGFRPIPRPRPGEYPAYVEMYLQHVPPDREILECLHAMLDSTPAFFRGLSPAQLAHRYAPDKWSVKDILVHLVDDERIFAYRALRFARGEQANLVGFDQDAYALEAGTAARSLDSILVEYVAVRWATLALFQGLPEASLTRMGHGTGTANDATVRALAWHIAGHELHHLAVIRERYL